MQTYLFDTFLRMMHYLTVVGDNQQRTVLYTFGNLEGIEPLTF